MIRSKLVTWLRGACRPTEPNCSSRFGGSNESDRNSDTPNDVHLGIAALAKARRIPAVLTTNFDRALDMYRISMGNPRTGVMFHSGSGEPLRLE
jgi:hypothetical protein